ncbi:tetratricopeptide repeat protein [Pyxidicoccus caerfyrddinensis]|uniref:tetratricopeptide repeat protein n=1 Tax=Pyxidicoccus caerfyrddinensis TaxID=2709663 RepID=UPI0013DCD888|nr:tetratricopeptide repeat protein [Pyxidicoccus caerfyrddinensis]
MPPALSNKALATVLSVVASGLAWAGPTVSGPYLGDMYGPVEFRTEGEQVIGTATGKGGACGFEPGTQVVKGELQGHVLVGSVLLCQTGPSCMEKQSHPALFFINAYDRVLSALVQPPKGCRSPALKDGLLLLLRSTAPQQDDSQDPEPEAADEEAAVPAPKAASAAAPAAEARRAPEAGVPSLEEGHRQLAAGNCVEAQRHFEYVLATDDRNPAAAVGLATCQLELGNVPGALTTLERMRASTRPDVHLWLAYAHLRDKKRPRAREALRRAMDLGWAPGNRPAEAVPEAALQEDIEALRQQRNRKRAPGREALGAGSTIP